MRITWLDADALTDLQGAWAELATLAVYCLQQHRAPWNTCNIYAASVELKMLAGLPLSAKQRDELQDLPLLIEGANCAAARVQDIRWNAVSTTAQHTRNR